MLESGTMIGSMVLAVAVGAWSTPIEVSGTIDGKPGRGRVLVYLPAGYSKERKHPLVIALHGWDHSPQLWKEKGDLSSFADKYGLVIAIPEMGQTIYETVFYPQSKGHWSAAPGTRWVAEVILPFLRQTYSVWSDRGHTAVIGYSTGGRGAVLLAEAYPQFAFAGSLSGTYQLMTLDPSSGEYKIHALVYGEREVFKARWELDNIVSPARLAKLSGTRLFIAHGGKDHVVNPNQLESLRAALEGRKVEVEYVVAADAGHDWAFWNSQWPRAFELAAQTLSSAPVPP